MIKKQPNFYFNFGLKIIQKLKSFYFSKLKKCQNPLDLRILTLYETYFFIWRRRESNQPSQSTDISKAAGAINFIDYVFDFVDKNKNAEKY